MGQSRSSVAVAQALLLGPHDPTDTMALEIPMVAKDAVWRLWQVPAVELQHRP